MADETLEILRKVMIDQALKRRDRESFYHLTGTGWAEFVVAKGAEPAPTGDPLAFLSDDPHFWDLRLYDTMRLHPYLNYRFRDNIDGVLYVGEIRVPLGWSGDIEAKFRPRPSSAPHVSPPDWFQSLLTTLVQMNR